MQQHPCLPAHSQVLGEPWGQDPLSTPHLHGPDLQCWLQQGTWPLSIAGASPSWNCLQCRLHSFLKLCLMCIPSPNCWVHWSYLCVLEIQSRPGFFCYSSIWFPQASWQWSTNALPSFPCPAVSLDMVAPEFSVVGELLPYVPGDLMGIFPLKVLGALVPETEWNWIKKNGLLLTSRSFVICTAMWNSLYPYFLFLFMPVTSLKACFLVPAVPFFVRFTSLIRTHIFFSHFAVLPGNQGALQVTTFTSEINNIDM